MVQEFRVGVGAASDHNHRVGAGMADVNAHRRLAGIMTACTVFLNAGITTPRSVDTKVDSSSGKLVSLVEGICLKLTILPLRARPERYGPLTKGDGPGGPSSSFKKKGIYSPLIKLDSIGTS